MSREAWALVKNNKNFNVHVYRRGLNLVIVSLLLSGIIAGLIFYCYVNWPGRTFYASSGVMAPIMLKPLSARNESSTALLPPDPPTDDESRPIPR